MFFDLLSFLQARITPSSGEMKPVRTAVQK
jgi:hypothetical protein